MIFISLKKKPHADVLNKRIDELTTLLWSYRTGYSLLGIICTAFFGAIGGGFLGYTINDASSILTGGSLGALFGCFLGYLNSYGVSFVSISSDGSFIAAGSKDANVYLFNRDGKLLRCEYGMDLKNVSISSDGSYIVEVLGHIIYLLDRQGDTQWSYKLDGGVTSVSLSFDSSHIVASSHVTEVKGDNIYDREDIIYFFDHYGKLLWDYKIECYDCSCCIKDTSISSDGSYVALVAKDNAYLFNREGKLLWEYEKSKIESVSVSSDGSYIAAGSNNEVHLLNREGKLLWSCRIDADVRCVSISSDGSCIAAMSYNSIYFLNNKRKLLSSYRTDGHIKCISISSDGSYIVAVSSNIIYVFNKDGKLLWKYKTGGKVNSISISSDGSFITAGSQDRNVYFFNFDMKNMLKN